MDNNTESLAVLLKTIEKDEKLTCIQFNGRKLKTWQQQTETMQNKKICLI